MWNTRKSLGNKYPDKDNLLWHLEPLLARNFVSSDPLTAAIKCCTGQTFLQLRHLSCIIKQRWPKSKDWLDERGPITDRSLRNYSEMKDSEKERLRKTYRPNRKDSERKELERNHSKRNFLSESFLFDSFHSEWFQLEPNVLLSLSFLSDSFWSDSDWSQKAFQVIPFLVFPFRVIPALAKILSESLLSESFLFEWFFSELFLYE
jgi:hypothetical protein